MPTTSLSFARRDSHQVEYTSFRMERREADGQTTLEERIWQETVHFLKQYTTFPLQYAVGYFKSVYGLKWTSLMQNILCLND
jgi:hypothetical protein